MKLTDNECKNAIVPSGKKSTQLRDEKGLYLEIRANGAKYWRMKYTSPITKKQVIHHLGAYPAMNLKTARIEANKAWLLINDGIDPKDQKQAEKAEHASKIKNTFEVIAKEWHSNRASQPDKWTPHHANRILRSLEIHVFPYFAKRSIADIMPNDVLTILKRIEKAGKHDTAHRVYDVVNQVFSYAVRLRLCLYNPASELRRELASVKQNHYPHLTNPKDIAELLRVIDGYNGSIQVRTIMKISPYVFTRPSELRMMKWEEIDFQNALWRKSGTGDQVGERMKNGLDHFIPLCRQVMELIESMKPFTAHQEYVFYNPSTKKPVTIAAGERALHRLGYKGIMTPHGFRHMASTLLNEKGYNKDWIERQLAHKDENTMRDTYNGAQYLEDRAQMMQEWADYLDELKQTQ